MGSSYANIHVRIGERDPEATMDRLESSLAEWMAAAGFERTEDGSDPDRTVKLGVDPGGRWVNVYDETSDIQQDHQSLGLLAMALAGSIDGMAVAASVFDSDLAWLALVDGAGISAELVHGQEMDDSGQFVAMLPEDFSRWAPVIAGGASSGDLRRVWTVVSTAESYISADDRAGNACELFGIDGLRATTGYRHLDFLPPNTDLRTLGFRIADEKKVAASMGRSVGDDMPHGLYIGGMDSVDVKAGSPFEIQLQVVNFGPEPIEGVLVWAEGPALEGGYVRLDSAKSVVLGPSGVEEDTAALASSSGSRQGVAAQFDSLSLPPYPTLTTSGRSYGTMFQAQASVRVTGSAIKAGRSSLVFAAFSRVQVETGAGSKAEGVEVDVTIR